MSNKPCEHCQIAYIYLLQDGKDRGTDIYKIGRTTQNNKDTRTLNRLKNYSRNTIVYNLFHVSPSQVITIEEHIIKVFTSKFSLVRGKEWFKGNVYHMKKHIDKIIDLYNTKQNDTETESNHESDIIDTDIYEPSAKLSKDKEHDTNLDYKKMYEIECLMQKRSDEELERLWAYIRLLANKT